MGGDRTVTGPNLLPQPLNQNSSNHAASLVMVRGSGCAQPWVVVVKESYYDKEVLLFDRYPFLHSNPAKTHPYLEP